MNRPTLLALSLALLAFVLGGLFLEQAVAARDSSYRHLSNFSETLDLVQKNYVEPADLGQLMSGALRGLTEAFDPDSFYLDPASAQRFKASRTADGRVGIGIAVSKRHGYAAVLAVWSGGPAAGQLATGDYLRAIDGVSTREMNVFEIEERLKGPPASEVQLKVLQRESMETRTVTLRRAAVTPAAPRRSEPRPGIVALRLEAVDAASLAALRRELAPPASGGPVPQGLVLDLRGCASGRLADGARLADLFLDAGTTLRVYGRVGEEAARRELGDLALVREAVSGPPRDQRPSRAAASPGPGTTPRPSPAGEPAALPGFELRISARPDDTLWRGPLVVLIDAGTAGAAEVAAAALQDAGRAAVLGTRSFGRGGISDTLPFADGSALRLTIARTVSPLGRSLLGQGLEPDEVVEGRPEAGRDPALDKAIERLEADGRAKKAA